MTLQILDQTVRGQAGEEKTKEAALKKKKRWIGATWRIEESFPGFMEK